MKTLPELPNLNFLLREAKAVKSQHRNRDAGVCETIGHYDTSLHGLTDQQIFDKHFSILDAQRVVARLYGFSSWTKMKQFVSRCWDGQNPTDTKLREEILTRHQKLSSLQKEIENNKDKKLYVQYREDALKSTDILNKAFRKHGWPGPEVVGPDCVEPLFFLSGNAVYDAQFQHSAVGLMEEALSSGGFFARFYAQLQDRNSVLSNKPCIYGTTFGSYYNSDGICELLEPDVIDPDNLDKRRARVGLTSKEMEKNHYINEAKEKNWKLSTREQSLKELNQVSIEGGYSQL